MPRTRKIRYLWLLLLAVQPVFAQVDSLVDVFPLAEGNRWIYGSASRTVGHYGVTSDTGTVDITVIGKIVTADSVRWQMFQRRRLVSIIDSTSFELVEKLDGPHQLICSVGFPFASGYLLDFNLPDTCKLYRFAPVDSTGVFQISLYSRWEAGYTDFWTYIFQQSVGMTSAVLNHSDFLSSTVYSLSLRDARFPSQPVIPLCVPEPRRLAIAVAQGMTLEETITLSNPGTGTMYVTGATVDNPHFDLVLDHTVVPASSAAHLRVRCLYDTVVQDTARIFVTSNAASSPDTVTIFVSGSQGTQISFDSRFFHFGDAVVLGNPRLYPLTITNLGPALLRIDSVISDKGGFTGLHRLQSVPAGGSGVDTIEFKPLHIEWNTGNVVYYSNSITSPDTVTMQAYGLGAVPKFLPQELAFPASKPGVPLTKEVLLHNVGNLEMTSGRLISTNPVFQAIPDTLQLGIDSFATVQVRYTPTNADSQSGMILAYNHPVPPETLYVSAGAGMSDTTSNKPTAFSLAQNFPNPFNSRTTIRFALPSPAHVTLKVFDILGQDVATITDEHLGQGTYERNFDASGLASGLYVYRLMAGAYAESRKMILTK
jgi:hypothetical protein